PQTQRDQVIWLLKNLCALYQNTGRRGEAEPYLRELLTVQRAALPPGDPRLADPLVDLAGACFERDGPGEAAQLLHEALAIREAALGPDHPQSVELRNALAALQASVDQPESPPNPFVSASPSAMERFHDCMRAFITRDYPAASERALALMSDGTITHGL